MDSNLSFQKIIDETANQEKRQGCYANLIFRYFGVQSFSFGNPHPKLKLWTPISHFKKLLMKPQIKKNDKDVMRT
ncbi:hypothetical protein PN36_33425 [Candidatus Thiomargarita nelsonii]|uniref:Uncharacterized protein n=1 Tax=Candidatus Thiomargarita nelsonii TaxID=1003181 RepID=A0A4E0QJV6_9GAMM|nr:hypothetical protein PN36_33425 [Candidatus Thiomargarita nelsonii]